MIGRNVAVVGAQWGDEGKGKIVDLWGARADVIVRYQGGNNAGHTLVVEGKKTVLHLIPSGVLHPGKRCLIANGVVFDPEVFFKEVSGLQAAGLLDRAPHQVISVSERAHVILPYHRQLDRLREENSAKKTGTKIGTTVRGIGPAYEDKASRKGIQVIDLIHPNLLRGKLAQAIEEKNILFKHHFGEAPIELDPLFESCLKMGEQLRPFIADVRALLMQAIQTKKSILFEGAQGTLLDIDHGTYPFVTSSNAVSGGALTGTGLGPHSIDSVIGITKAYTTRVGTGPFPSEIEVSDPAMAEQIRKIGGEFGATTGRSRRVGWLDLVALRYAVEVNGLTGIALMKSDVLSGIKTVKVCVGYRIDGKEVLSWPSCVEDLEKIEPIWLDVEGWESIKKGEIRDFSELPKALQAYVRLIEGYVGVPVQVVSTGPGREETLILKDPFKSKLKPE